MQKFEIEIDGVSKIASVINVVEIDNREFAIYTVDEGNDTSGVFYSEIVKDEEGYDKLIDVQDPKIRQGIMEIVNVMFS